MAHLFSYSHTHVYIHIYTFIIKYIYITYRHTYRFIIIYKYNIYMYVCIYIYIYIYISLNIYIPHIWYLSKLFVREAWSIEREVLSSNPFLCSTQRTTTEGSAFAWPNCIGNCGRIYGSKLGRRHEKGMLSDGKSYQITRTGYQSLKHLPSGTYLLYFLI